MNNNNNNNNDVMLDSPVLAEDESDVVVPSNNNNNNGLPNGVFTVLTDCYSPTCSRDSLCYSPSCPRRLEQVTFICLFSMIHVVLLMLRIAGASIEKGPPWTHGKSVVIAGRKGKCIWHWRNKHE